MPALPNDGAEPLYRDRFPPRGGFRFELIVLPPATTDAGKRAPSAGALAEVDRFLPGLLSAMDPQPPGMHRTGTIDLIHVTSGRCVLELDGGAKLEL